MSHGTVSSPTPVDAIVVDEGQDFRAEWWQVVQAGLTSIDNGCLCIFHDNNQSLLAHRASYPISEPRVDLSRDGAAASALPRSFAWD